MRKILPAEENPALRKSATPLSLTEIGGTRVRKLIDDMRKLLAKEEYGVALAAPQVGVLARLFIVSGRALLRQAQDKSPASRSESKGEDQPDLSRAESRDEVYINPEIIKLSRGKKDKHEGCLSIRGKWGMVPRAEKTTIKAYDEHGRRITRGASGFLAHIFQHEMDHLEGVLYTDKATEIFDEEPEKNDEHP